MNGESRSMKESMVHGKMHVKMKSKYPTHQQLIAFASGVVTQPSIGRPSATK